jgi:hypothetical protein
LRLLSILIFSNKSWVCAKNLMIGYKMSYVPNSDYSTLGSMSFAGDGSPSAASSGMASYGAAGEQHAVEQTEGGANNMIAEKASMGGCVGQTGGKRRRHRYVRKSFRRQQEESELLPQKKIRRRRLSKRSKRRSGSKKSKSQSKSKKSKWFLF